MGHGQSKNTPRLLGDDERGIRLYCVMDESMVSSGMVPDNIVARYFLQSERYIILVDSTNKVYSCEVSESEGKFYLTVGWDSFVQQTGVAVGDFMMFDIRGADETLVWVIPTTKSKAARGLGESSAAAGVAGASTPGMLEPEMKLNPQPWEDAARVATTAVIAEASELGASSVDCDVKAVHNPISVAQSTSGLISITSSTSYNSVGSDTTSTGYESAEDISRSLEEWRTKFILGRNVVLEDRMVEFVATGMDWEIPEFGIYVCRVEDTSIAENKLRLPRLFTTEHVLPLLQDERKTLYMWSGKEGDKRMKFSIGKDGRASLTEGWADFVVSNGLRAGSVLAFSFSGNQTELDIAIDVLAE